MQLSDVRAEILNHGFDPNFFNAARLNQYINDGYNLICRRTDYYIDEASQAVATTSGVATFPLPANFARARSLLDTDRELELTAVGLRDIDRSFVTTGSPNYYAFSGQNIELYPIPDGVHNLLFRYWTIPAPLVNDTDVPTLPPDWHWLLWLYGCWMCFEAEDDQSQGPAYQQRFATGLAEFQADQKFPNDDSNWQVKSMWDQGKGINTRGWSVMGAGWF